MKPVLFATTTLLLASSILQPAAAAGTSPPPPVALQDRHQETARLAIEDCINRHAPDWLAALTCIKALPPAPDHKAAAPPPPQAVEAAPPAAPAADIRLLEMEYAAGLKHHLQSQWNKYSQPYGNRSLEATIILRLDRRGKLLSLAMEKSSGNPGFDRHLLVIIGNAAPFPTPPAALPGESFEHRLRIRPTGPR